MRQLKLIIRFRGRLKVKKYTVHFPKNIEITIDKDANLCFEDKCYLSEAVRISVFNFSAVKIGENFFMNRNSSIVSRYGVIVGKNCMIAESVFIYDHDHCFSDLNVPFRLQGYKGAPITIGDNVWIGAHVLIGKGVNIGNNTVIAAGSIVVKDVPSNSILKPQNITKAMALDNNRVEDKPRN
jgi:acetyltransferase-like isoleucine patch superfamily enzyme